MFCVAPPELETKMNITKGGLVLFSANSNSSCMELSKKIADFFPLSLLQAAGGGDGQSAGLPGT
uniref:Phosphoribosyl pyrophosphate synthetase associated protein 2 n=1 Tax=Equus caballus TaxID=9796 RepID=A0A5F5PN15_HORSE